MALHLELCIPESNQAQLLQVNYPPAFITCNCIMTYRIRPNYRTVRLGISNLQETLICGQICIYLLRLHYKKDQKRIY